MLANVADCVFPTCVGMNRVLSARCVELVGVPHVRGDEPRNPHLCRMSLVCSLRAWG